MQTIQCKFSKFVLIPAVGINPRESEFQTMDGTKVAVFYQATWNNKDGAYEDELDALCQERWNVPFGTLRSVWIGRLGMIDNYWHLIKLKKL